MIHIKQSACVLDIEIFEWKENNTHRLNIESSRQFGSSEGKF